MHVATQRDGAHHHHQLRAQHRPRAPDHGAPFLLVNGVTGPLLFSRSEQPMLKTPTFRSALASSLGLNGSKDSYSICFKVPPKTNISASHDHLVSEYPAKCQQQGADSGNAWIQTVTTCCCLKTCRHDPARTNKNNMQP